MDSEAYMVLEADVAALAAGYQLESAIKATQYLLHALLSQRLAESTIKPRAMLRVGEVDYSF